MLDAKRRGRILLLGASALGLGLLFFAGRFFDVPVHRGFEASLAQQPSVIFAFLLVLFCFALTVALGTAIAGHLSVNAGLLVGCLSLAGFSALGGTMRDVMLWAQAQQTAPLRLFIVLAVETLLLGIIIAAAWWALRELRCRGVIARHQSAIAKSGSVGDQLTSLAAQVAVTAGVVLLLAPVSDKLQSWAAVFLASLVGAIVTQYARPAGEEGWHWSAPLLVGIVGYLITAAYPAGFLTANLSGTFADLAHPLPLDYASFGPAGAIIGHWLAEKWRDKAEPEGEAA